MLPRYVRSLVLTLLLISLILANLPFATRSQVRAGAAVDETWNADFVLDAGAKQTYIVDDELKALLEERITLVPSGVAHIRSTKIEITPKQVSWTENKTNYKAPGARLSAHVNWDTPADSPNGARGSISLEFPTLRGFAGSPVFHSGGYQKVGGHWVFRDVTAYQGSVGVAVGRFLYVLAAALPMAILLQGIWWAFQISKEKKSRLAELTPADPTALPRAFYPSPTAEWGAWTLTVCIVGGVGSLIAFFVIYDGFMSSLMDRVLMIMQGVGAFIGLLIALGVRARVVTVQVDADSIAYAKGRGDPQWVTARWSDLQDVQQKSQTYKGNTTHWLEIRFPDGRKRKIPESIQDYATLRDTILARAPGRPQPV